MTAVLSVTNNDFYAYPLPIVAWSWHKVGIKTIVFHPDTDGGKVVLAKKYCPNTKFYSFKCEERKEATYAQVSRLFGATVCKEGVLIIGDADLAVFGDEFNSFLDGDLRILGGDLLSDETNQYPMCFTGMSFDKWQSIFELHGKSLQEALDETVGKLESVTFRGDFWGFDQWYLRKKIQDSGVSPIIVNRAKYPERFATRRLDRDDAFLLHRINLDIIDYHLPRPAYEENNFNQIMTVLKYFYPNDDFGWLIDYRNEYLKLI